MTIEKKQVGSFRDDRGILTWASKKLLDFDYAYLTIGTIEPNHRRGDHYHKETYEQFMCVEGRITFVLDDEQVVMHPGDIVDIPVMKVHTFINEADKTAYFIEFKSMDFDPQNPDTFKRGEE